MLLRLLILGLLLVLAYAIVRKKIRNLKSWTRLHRTSTSHKPEESAWAQDEQVRDAEFKDLDA